MSKISLKHSGGNVVSLNSPTNAPGAADVAFKLPNTDGSAGQFMKTDGSGNLSFDAAGGGKFASYALLKDTKSQNTDGGTFTSGAWRTRDLNTEISDEDGIVSISSNQFTLAAGNYFIKFQAPALKVNFHQTRLRNITDSISYNGTSEYSQNSDAFQTVSFGVARVAITGSKVFEVQHRCTDTKTTDGFGQPAYGFGDESIYTLVEIFKEL